MDKSKEKVHMYKKKKKKIYNLEHLWADAKLTHIPDLD